MDPLQAVSLFRPLTSVDNVGAVGAGHKATKPQSANPFAGAATGGIAGINGELTPSLGAQGSSYTHGLGISKHTLNLVG